MVARASLTVTVASLGQAVGGSGPMAIETLQRAIDAMAAKSVSCEQVPESLWQEVQRRLAA